MDKIGFKGLYSIKIQEYPVLKELEENTILRFKKEGINCIARKTEIGESTCFLDIISFGKPEDEMTIISELFSGHPISLNSYKTAVGKFSESFMKRYVGTLLRIYETDKLTTIDLLSSFDSSAFQKNALNLIM